MFGLASKKFYALSGVVVGLCIVQACSREVPPEASCSFVQNQNSQRVSWEQNVPVSIYLDNSVPTTYRSAIEAAIAEWNLKGQETVGHDYFRLKSGNPGSAAPTRDGYTKIYFLNTWEPDKKDEQARTTVYWTGTRIYEADIRINDLNFDFYVGSTPDKSKVHIESLAVHELGHVLGLAHINEATSVMQARLANGTERDEPSSVDLSSLSCEY